METFNDMSLRIKEVLKSKGLNMTKLAEMMDINPVSLSATVNGNPTVAWLQKVADLIGVEVADLIERKEPPISGCVMVGDEMYPIRCKKDVLSLAEHLKES